MKIIESGKCGDNVSYELTEDGVLRIFGIGGIFNYNHEYFYKKENIKQVIIAKGVTMIGNCAFKDCTSLKLIDIPNSVTRIGSGVFEGCTSLKSINVNVLNESYSSDNGVLYNKDKSSLLKYPLGKIETSFIILNSVKEIGSSVFKGCTSLESIVIPNGVTEIGNSAFEGCTSLKLINIPNSVIKISGGVFKNTAWLNNQPDGVIYINDVLYKYKGVMLENIHIKIKDGITQICSSAFSGCTLLEAIDLPNSVTEIGSSVFKGCTSLKSIVIPKGVMDIENYAFEGCTSLKSINIPNSVTKIGRSAFEGCTSLESIVIPNGVTEIGNSAFEGCTSLKLINIPNSVTNIGWFAFYNCTSLESIVIPNGVTEIGISTFEGCTSLKSIDIPNSVTEISGCAFKNTAWLNDQPDGVIYINDVLYKYKGVMLENIHIKIKDGITQICNSAFSGCTLLEAIDLPNSVTEIGSSVFEGCTSLKSINVDVLNDNYLSEKGVLYNKDKSLLIRYPLGKLESLFVVPNSVAEIGSGAFEGCTSLKSIDIPNSVTEIGYNAFYGCTSLESVNIPDSVEMIENCKFEGCTSLKIMNVPSKCSFCCCKNFIGRETIISSATEPFKMKCKYRKCGPYERLNFSIPVYVPKGSKKAYHEHEEWGKFTNIKEIDGRCGEDSYYELLENGTLNIFGKDEMYDDFVFDKSKIKKVRVTENICMIGANAFKDCRKLRIVEIESPLEEIADGAFSGCENIFSMTIASEIPPIVSEHTLEGLMRTIEIRVPANAIRYYKAAKYWNEFTNYVAID